MSITYFLYLAEDRSPSEVLKTVGAAMGVEVHLIVGARAAQTSIVGGLDVSAHRVEAPVDVYTREDHGISPRLLLTIRLDQHRLEEAQDRLTDLMTAILSRVAGDVLLLREDESLALRRKTEALEVNPSDPLWASADRRAKLGDYMGRMNS